MSDSTVVKVNSEVLHIIVPTNGEKYNGRTEVGVALLINYIDKSYKIIPPPMDIETCCKYLLYVAEAIKKAYGEVMLRLYKNKIKC